MAVSFISKVSDFISRHQLMSPACKYLVALSGGADSVALLLVSRQLGFDVEAIHCNFHLRGEESDRDEKFCKDFCESLQVPLHLAHFDTLFYAETHKVSVEMAARELRYRYFERLRTDLQADGILVAHHQDDSVETVLMNLIRGTGMHGLTGISPRNGHILRPLLSVTRQEIEQFLVQKNQSYVTDSTNLVPDVVRNKIRLEVLPLLCTINPSVSASIAATSERLSLAASIFDEAVAQKAEAARITVNEPVDAAYNVQKIDNEYVLFHILSAYSFTPAQIEDIYRYIEFAAPSHQPASGSSHPSASDSSHPSFSGSQPKSSLTGSLFSSSSHEALIDRGRLLIHPKEASFKPMRIPVEGNYVLPSDSRLVIKEQLIDENFHISRDANCVCLDANRVQFPLTLRPTQDGDRFQPLGMKGSRLVSDFLTDRKYSLFQKRRQLVLTDATGQILWLIGLRPAHWARITPDTTKALIISTL